jgi:hypothetical protein
VVGCIASTAAARLDTARVTMLNGGPKMPFTLRV